MPSNLPNKIGGIPFLDKTELITSGRVFWVGSGTGSNSAANAGRDPRLPLASIDYAIGLCTANKGDVIYVMPGHAETISAAAGINCDIAGISIIGLGNGTNRPLITLGTATTADFDINAANVLVKNLQFTSAIDSLENFITVGANNATIEDCYFYTASTYEAVCFINIETTFDDTTINRCVFKQGTDPGGTDAAVNTGAIYLVDSENVSINDCHFYGQFETAFIHNKTTAATNLWVRNCTGYSSLATSQIFLLVEGATGGEKGGLFVNPAGTDVTTAQLFGVESTKFFASGYYGNDSDGGGQGAVQITAAA